MAVEDEPIDGAKRLSCCQQVDGLRGFRLDQRVSGRTCLWCVCACLFQGQAVIQGKDKGHNELNWQPHQNTDAPATCRRPIIDGLVAPRGYFCNAANQNAAFTTFRFPNLFPSASG